MNTESLTIQTDAFGPWNKGQTFHTGDPVVVYYAPGVSSAYHISVGKVQIENRLLFVWQDFFAGGKPSVPMENAMRYSVYLYDPSEGWQIKGGTWRLFPCYDTKCIPITDVKPRLLPQSLADLGLPWGYTGMTVRMECEHKTFDGILDICDNGHCFLRNNVYNGYNFGHHHDLGPNLSYGVMLIGTNDRLVYFGDPIHRIGYSGVTMGYDLNSYAPIPKPTPKATPYPEPITPEPSQNGGKVSDYKPEDLVLLYDDYSIVQRILAANKGIPDCGGLYCNGLLHYVARYSEDCYGSADRQLGALNFYATDGITYPMMNYWKGALSYCGETFHVIDGMFLDADRTVLVRFIDHGWQVFSSIRYPGVRWARRLTTHGHTLYSAGLAEFLTIKDFPLLPCWKKAHFPIITTIKAADAANISIKSADCRCKDNKKLPIGQSRYVENLADIVPLVPCLKVDATTVGIFPYDYSNTDLWEWFKRTDADKWSTAETEIVPVDIKTTVPPDGAQLYAEASVKYPPNIFENCVPKMQHLKHVPYLCGTGEELSQPIIEHPYKPVKGLSLHEPEAAFDVELALKRKPLKPISLKSTENVSLNI